MEKRETAGLTIRLIIEYVRAVLGEEGVARLLEMAGEERPLDVLENPRNWSSYEHRIELFEAAAAVTNDPRAARRIGASILKSNGSVLLRSLLLPFRSPKSLMRALPMVHAKFDAAGESDLVELRPGSARIAYRVRPPHLPSRHDCLYTEGLLSQVSALFGLPAARVVQRTCQSDGAPSCVIDVSWHAGRRFRSSRAEDRVEQAGLARLQLDELEETLAELMQIEDPDEVLRRVMQHAGSSVAAQRLLLAAALGGTGTLSVHSEGIPHDEAARIAADLVAGRQVCLEDGSHHVLCSAVRSPRREYGTLAAFSSGPFVEGEQGLLDSYARLAAVTLDTRSALEAANERRRFAELLGGFARRLIEVKDVAELSQATASAALSVTGAGRALLAVHNEKAGSMTAAAHAGYSEEQRALADAFAVLPADTPGLARVIAEPELPRVLDRSSDDELVRTTLSTFGLRAAAIVPVRSDQRLFGLLVAGFTDDRPPPQIDEELLARLAAVADQAAGAWQRALLSEQLRRQADLDPLTGLVNRRVFTDLLADLLRWEADRRFAVLFCDLDDFKRVNDALGHAAGDDLLIAVARRLQHCVRSDDLVARLGGDEFTVLLRDVDGGWTPNAFAHKVRKELAQPIEIEGSQVSVSLSFGAVLATGGGSTVKEVLRRADAAMYVAKTRGGDQLLVFEEAMLLARSEPVELETSLAQALGDLGQFELLYQPQIDLASGRVVAAEALVRWDHPRRGRLAPDQFLAVAEKTGLVVPLDLHVLKSALAQATYWRSTGMELRVSVNMSAPTLASPTIVSEVKAALEKATIPGVLLEIELKESSAAADPGALSETLLALSDLGVSIAIDDVGTDHSSLSLLHRLAAQRIKLDRGLVRQVLEDPATHSLVEAVVLLARRLGQGVIAEGIETTDQAAELRRLGCELAQGCLYSRPVRPDELALFARRPQQVHA